MREFTIYAMENGGRIGGMGFYFPPTKRDYETAKDHYIFRRGDCRVHVFVVSGTVTIDECRQLAANLYEGKGREVNFEDAAHRRIAALSRKYATP